jgi:hypothetical protein
MNTTVIEDKLNERTQRLQNSYTALNNAMNKALDELPMSERRDFETIIDVIDLHVRIFNHMLRNKI